MRVMMLQATDFNDMDKMLFLKNMMDHSSNFYAIRNKDSRIVAANDAVARYTGFASSVLMMEQRLRTEDFRCKTAALAECLYAEDNQIFNTPQQLSFIALTCFADNQWYMMYGTKTPLIDASGKAIGLIDNYIDITHNPFFNFSHIFFDEAIAKRDHTIDNQFSYTIVDTLDEFNISQRQLECLFYLLRGKSANEIALVLGLSKRTVETHIENIKFKLQCDNKNKVIEFAIDNGLLNYLPRTLLTSKNKII
jgi:DNA-binding CsgD family transcriptional regulator